MERMERTAIPLPQLAAALLTRYGRTPQYRTLYAAALDGTLPAFNERGRWYVRARDLATIADFYGLTPQAA